MLHTKDYPGALALCLENKEIPKPLWDSLTREERDHLNDLVAARIAARS